MSFWEKPKNSCLLGSVSSGLDTIEIVGWHFMSEKDWWSYYGSFKRWRECPTRPDPADVLLFYLRKLDIKPEEQIDYLMDLLDLQKSMVYNILKGEGFDSVS